MFLNFAPRRKRAARTVACAQKIRRGEAGKNYISFRALNIRYKRYDGRIIARALRENLAYPLAYLRRQSLALRAGRARELRDRGQHGALKLAEGAAVVRRIYASARLYLHRRRGLHRSVEHDGDDDEAVLRHFAPLAQDTALELAEHDAVDEHRPGLNAPYHLSALSAEAKLVAVLQNKDVLRSYAHLARKLRVAHKMAVLAVARHEELRPRQAEHQHQLVARGVARDVNLLLALVDNLRAAGEEPVHRLAHELLVAGNRRRGDDYQILRPELHLAVRSAAHKHEAGERLALASRRQHDDVVVRHVFRLLRRNDKAVRHIEIAELSRELDVRRHAAADEHGLAVEARRRRENHLRPVEIACEGRDYDAPVLIEAEETLEGLPDDLLRRRGAGTLDVRRVGHQQKHALVPEARESAVVGPVAVRGRRVEFEISGVDDDAERRVNGEREGVGNRMAELNELHLEASRGNPVARADVAVIGCVARPRVHHFVLDKPAREPRAVDRHVEPRQHERQRADMILVSVRYKNRLYLRFILYQIFNVRNDEINPEHIFLGKLQPAVHDYKIVAAAENGEILPDLPHPAERADRQLRLSLQPPPHGGLLILGFGHKHNPFHNISYHVARRWAICTGRILWKIQTRK